jgi:hypothetical protein
LATQTRSLTARSRDRLSPHGSFAAFDGNKEDCWQPPASLADPVVHEVVAVAAGVAEYGTDSTGLTPASAWAIEVWEADMTRAELDAALARLGLAVPEGERDQIVAAAHLIENMVVRLRPVSGGDVAAEPAHVVCFPEE